MHMLQELNNSVCYGEAAQKVWLANQFIGHFPLTISHLLFGTEIGPIGRMSPISVPKLKMASKAFNAPNHTQRYQSVVHLVDPAVS